MKIYVVVGSNGEYSDYSEWIVAAFSTDEAATEWARLAGARTEELWQRAKALSGPDVAYGDPRGTAWFASQERKELEAALKRERNEYDAHIENCAALWLSDRTCYGVSECELDPEMPGEEAK